VNVGRARESRLAPMALRARRLSLAGKAWVLLGIGLVGSWTCHAGGAGHGASLDVKQTQPATSATPSRTREGVERLRVRVRAVRPHDPAAFTQGLLLHQGEMYESTGQYGQSSLRRVDPESGGVLAHVPLAPDLFGEGLALVGERLIQLTWKAGLALAYDRRSLRPLPSFRYAGEGWGLAYDGTALMMSDGSDTLTFRDPTSFEIRKRLRVTLRGRPLTLLNELEWAQGRVFANVWLQDWIARIDPESGRVDGVIDASRLLTEAERSQTDVLNGIAYDRQTGRFLLTGKLWPKLFEVDFVPAGAD